jgi:hypothetical protein
MHMEATLRQLLTASTDSGVDSILQPRVEKATTADTYTRSERWFALRRFS